MDWRIGKIDKLLCSKDGEVPSEDIVVIKNGQKLKLQRSTKNLYPFEWSTDKDEVKLKFAKNEDIKMMRVVLCVYVCVCVCVCVCVYVCG